HFLLCGMGVTTSNAQLSGWIEEEGLVDRCHLLGPRQDMPRIFAGIDIAASSSAHEAFPVVVGEAMGCATPCVVTDVGDAGMVVGPTGLVVPPGDPQALSDALRELIRIGPEARRKLGAAARLRVAKHFPLAEVVERYEQIYEAVAYTGGKSRPKQNSPCPDL